MLLKAPFRTRNNSMFQSCHTSVLGLVTYAQQWRSVTIKFCFIAYLGAAWYELWKKQYYCVLCIHQAHFLESKNYEDKIPQNHANRGTNLYLFMRLLSIWSELDQAIWRQLYPNCRHKENWTAYQGLGWSFNLWWRDYDRRLQTFSRTDSIIELGGR